jgi:hypothetical protein
MLLHIQYPDKRYDYISTAMLDRLIRNRIVKKFFRPSEDRWVDIDLDPVRGEAVEEHYDGMERRSSGLTLLQRELTFVGAR